MLDPAFLEIQAEWYGKLAQEGFKDLEDTSNPERPLRRWSGTSWRMEYVGVQGDIVYHSKNAFKNTSPWPENPFRYQEDLFYHPDVLSICDSICKHGNHSLKPIQVKLILEYQLQGMTCRDIGIMLGIGYVTVFRVQKKILEWAKLIENGRTN